ncbi:MAG: D-2-hydroxyacid dehydrogenase [Chloroflexota bacterium]
MEQIKVLVLAPIGDENLRQIEAIGPRIKMTDAANLFRGEQNGESAATARLNSLLANTEVIFGLRLPARVLSRAPNLKWIQVMSAGMNRFLDAEMVQSPVTMTNVSGIHATPISEFVLAQMLMLVKQVPVCFQMKQRQQWQRVTPGVLRSKTVGIVGLGNIGREVARLAKAFGMKVLATRRSAKASSRARYVDLLLPSDKLPQLLAESDFVVLTLPQTPETIKLIGEKELRAMKPTAYLVNIARGGIIDEAVLIRALEGHWIAGAGLDVFETEPLPPASKLWQIPNAILSPHIAGGMADYNTRATAVFCDNLRRYADGKKLHNIVDKQKGY